MQIKANGTFSLCILFLPLALIFKPILWHHHPWLFITHLKFLIRISKPHPQISTLPRDRFPLGKSFGGWSEESLMSLNVKKRTGRMKILLCSFLFPYRRRGGKVQPNRKRDQAVTLLEEICLLESGKPRFSSERLKTKNTHTEWANKFGKLGSQPVNRRYAQPARSPSMQQYDPQWIHQHLSAIFEGQVADGC